MGSVVNIYIFCENIIFIITIENNEYWFPCRHHNMSIATHDNNIDKNKAKLEYYLILNIK